MVGNQIEKYKEDLCALAIKSDLRRRLDAALHALHLMVEQYCATDKKTESGLPIYDDLCMTAGEEACQVLQNEGRITSEQW